MTFWDIEASLRWQSADARHCERRFVAAFDPGRDLLPAGLGTRAADLAPGESVRQPLAPGEGWIASDPSLRLRLRRDQFRRVEVKGIPVEPRAGRFYPRSLLAGVPGAAAADRRPFRILACDAESIEADLNHPLAGRPLQLEIRRLGPAVAGATGAARDVLALLADDGPGMQAELPGGTTDFESGNPHARADDADDALFYAPPRLVAHLDASALRQLTSLYAPLLAPGMAVLDLMSSWDSHLPETPADLTVTGLGMNRTELEHNPRLAVRLVHDLNRDPRLPFPDASFDALLCSLSAEYLTRPVEVWREAARVLRPGAPCALTFSERWFPPKAVRIWSALHPFERVGLVLHALRRSGGFGQFSTTSLRGIPRPPGDKYAHLTPWSDPLYLVVGHARR
jgi:SAM-dependent methyltransferase